MKNIVILGAGFGGIRAAKELDRKLGKIAVSSRGDGTPRNDDEEKWRVILVDQNSFHVYYPKLFEEVLPQEKDRHAPTVVGTRDDENGKCTVSLHEILKGTGVEFLQAAVQGIDFEARIVQCSEGDALSFEYLILALGADADYFGIPGLKENAVVLRSLQDAKKIREKVEEFLKKICHPEERSDEGSLANASHAHSDEILRAAQNDKFEVIIGGAGATGVELAASLAYQFRDIEKSKWSVTIVEALPRVLSMFPNGLSQYAHRRLEKLGVHLMLDTCIKEVKEGGEVILVPRPLKPGESEDTLLCDFLPEHEKRMFPDLLLWTGGVAANSLLEKCGMPTDKKGRVEVDGHMAVKGMEGIFAIGDNALLIDPMTKQPVPGTAQAALAEAEIAAKNILASIRGKTLVRYAFPKFSAIVPLAGRDCVALFQMRVIKGLPAWLLRQAADCRYFASITGWYRAVKKCIL
ncbi:MAG: FAD-dependent oxidoreductase [bacterium]|nr:FAD-dependent oxidoreductase [bacterium]